MRFVSTNIKTKKLTLKSNTCSTLALKEPYGALTLSYETVCTFNKKPFSIEFHRAQENVICRAKIV